MGTPNICFYGELTKIIMKHRFYLFFCSEGCTDVQQLK